MLQGLRSKLVYIVHNELFFENFREPFYDDAILKNDSFPGWSSSGFVPVAFCSIYFLALFDESSAMTHHVSKRRIEALSLAQTKLLTLLWEEKFSRPIEF